MNTDPSDPYAVLGIARGATAAAVKQAYFALVRRHTPEDDPDGFRRISEAYRVLSDPAERARLESEEQFAPAAVEALQRAEALVDDEPDEAVAAARQALAVSPDSPGVRFAVAWTFERCGRADEALPMFERLTREHPGRVEYAESIAAAYARRGRMSDAEVAARRAIAIDPARRMSYATIAEIEMASGRPDVAVRTLDAGIAHDGVVDLGDLPLLLRKAAVLAWTERWDALARVLAEIRGLVPEGDGAAKAHVAAHLRNCAGEHAESNAYDVARLVMEAAVAVDPDPELRELLERLGPPAATARACRDAAKDPQVAEWIRALLPPCFGRRMSDGDWRAVCIAASERMRKSRALADREWAAFAGRYAAAAERLRATRAELLPDGQAAPADSGARHAGAFIWMIVAVVVMLIRLQSCTGSSAGPPPRFDPTAYARDATRRVTAEEIQRMSSPEYRANVERAMEELRRRSQERRERRRRSDGAEPAPEAR